MTHEMMDENEKRKIIRLYGVLGFSILCSFVPHTLAAVAALIAFTAVLMMAYSVRRGAAAESVTSAHATWIVRTIWLASFFAMVTVGLASIYVLSAYDPSPVHECAAGMMNGEITDVNDCVESFMAVNGRVFLIGALFSGIPVLAYLAFRLYRGWMLLRKGEGFPNVKAWL